MSIQQSPALGTPNSESHSASGTASPPAGGGDARRIGAVVARLFQDSSSGIGLVIVVVWILAAVLAPWISPFGPNEQQGASQLLAPGANGHLLGTDELGRDILSRVLHGARLAVGVGFSAVAIGAAIGSIAGLAAGYFGGFFETAVMRLSDVLLAYPGILLGVVVVATLGTGTVQVAIAIAVINIPIFARLSRSGTLRERELDYVAAAKIDGVGAPRILLRHIFPNVLGPILVQASISVGHAVLIEAGLSFLGLGAQPPAPSWGSMLDQSRDYLTQSPTFAIAPGLALASLLLGLNLLADGLGKTLSPGGRAR